MINHFYNILITSLSKQAIKTLIRMLESFSETKVIEMVSKEKKRLDEMETFFKNRMHKN